MSNQRGIYIINTFLNRKFGEEKKKNSKCLLLDLTLNSKEEHCQKCKTDNVHNKGDLILSTELIN